MRLNIKKAAKAGVSVRIEKNTLVLEGTRVWPDPAIIGMDALQKALEFSDTDRDRIAEHIADVQVISVIREMADR